MGTGEMLRPEDAGGWRAVARNPWLWLATGLVFAFTGAMLLPWVLHNLGAEQGTRQAGVHSGLDPTAQVPWASNGDHSKPQISEPGLTLEPQQHGQTPADADWLSISTATTPEPGPEGGLTASGDTSGQDAPPAASSPDSDQPTGTDGDARATTSWELPRPLVAPVFGTIIPAAAYSPLPPLEVRGVHASSNQAGSSRMTSIVETMTKAGLNAVVVEIKDEYGKLAYQSQVPLAREIKAGTNRISDVRAFLDDLHDRGFYVIARLVTFQDGVLAAARPQLAITRRTGGLWRNSQDLAWADPGRAEVWRYQVDLAEEALHLGFDELQFDYVRFPTDGNVSDMRSVVPADRQAAAIAGFLAYARQRLAPYGRPVSADVFGFVATARDDLGIGQRLEDIAASVDFVSPMVYPSHYPKGSYGYDDPDAEPYGVIRHAMEVAVERIGAAKLRPWLQSFSLRHTYGPAEIAAQVRAVTESGVSGWLFWNASGRYSLLEGVPGTW